MPEPVKIGAVGLGGHGRALLKAITACDNLELAAGCDRDPELCRATGNEFGIPCDVSIESMLSRGDIEAVCIAAPNHLHAQMVSAASSAGKACFVEKPIANTVEEAEEMIAACRRAGVVLAVGHNFRRRGELREAKALLEKGELGGAVAAEGFFSRPGASLLPPDDWRRDPQKCPLPPMMQLGIHLVDSFINLFGPVDSVVAMASPPDSLSATSVVSMLRFSSGVFGSLVADYVLEERWSLRILGRTADLTLDDGVAIIDDRKSAPRARDVGAVDTLAEEIREFGEAVRGRGDVEVDGLAGLEALKVVRAMITSSAEKREVAIT